MFSACYTAVYGHLCGQKRFPLKADDDSTVLSGKRFAFSGLLHCNSEWKVMQVFSAKSAVQSLRGNKQRKRITRSLPCIPRPKPTWNPEPVAGCSRYRWGYTPPSAAPRHKPCGWAVPLPYLVWVYSNGSSIFCCSICIQLNHLLQS